MFSTRRKFINVGQSWHIYSKIYSRFRSLPILRKVYTDGPKFIQNAHSLFAMAKVRPYTPQFIYGTEVYPYTQMFIQNAQSPSALAQV